MSIFTEVKILLLGDSEVGKSSLFFRFKSGSFRANPPKSLANYLFKTANIQGKNIKVSVWDLSGQEKHRDVIPSYYEKVEGALFVYDVKDFKSLENLYGWLENFKSVNSTAEVILVGNKNEIRGPNSVTRTDVQRFAEDKNLQYVEVSARSGKNVEKVFMYLAERILVKRGVLSSSGDLSLSEHERSSGSNPSTPLLTKKNQSHDKSQKSSLSSTSKAENVDLDRLKKSHGLDYQLVETLQNEKLKNNQTPSNKSTSPGKALESVVEFSESKESANLGESRDVECNNMIASTKQEITSQQGTLSAENNWDVDHHCDENLPLNYGTIQTDGPEVELIPARRRCSCWCCCCSECCCGSKGCCTIL